MYYKCEVEGCLLLAGDTHAAQGDSELAGVSCMRLFSLAFTDMSFVVTHISLS